MNSEFAEPTSKSRRSRKRRELEYLAALLAVEDERHPLEDIERSFVMLTRS